MGPNGLAVHGQTAGDGDHLTGDEGSVGAAEEGNGAGQVSRQPQAAQGDRALGGVGQVGQAQQDLVQLDYIRK